MSGYDFDLRAWARNPVNLVSAVMIWGGLLAAVETQTNWLMAVFGAGLLGPTLLRELGLMRWEDEFQRDVATRAALHAFLAGGVLLVAVMGFNGFGGPDNPELKFKDAVPASSVLITLTLVWYLSRLLQYWGARKAAFRIWGFVGLVWLLVSLISIFTIDQVRENLSPGRFLMMLVPALSLLVLAWLTVGPVQRAWRDWSTRSGGSSEPGTSRTSRRACLGR